MAAISGCRSARRDYGTLWVRRVSAEFSIFIAKPEVLVLTGHISIEIHD
jgi:hypothetical protein